MTYITRTPPLSTAPRTQSCHTRTTLHCGRSEEVSECLVACVVSVMRLWSLIYHASFWRDTFRYERHHCNLQSRRLCNIHLLAMHSNASNMNFRASLNASSLFAYMTRRKSVMPCANVVAPIGIASSADTEGNTENASGTFSSGT